MPFISEARLGKWWAQTVSTSAFGSRETEKVIISFALLGGEREPDTNHLDESLAADCDHVRASQWGLRKVLDSPKRPRKLLEVRACLPRSVCPAKGTCVGESNNFQTLGDPFKAWTHRPAGAFRQDL